MDTSEDHLPDHQKSALSVWRSKLADLTNSQEQHAEAHRMIDQILGRGMTGKLNQIAERLTRLEEYVGVPSDLDSVGVQIRSQTAVTLPTKSPSKPKTERQKIADAHSDKVNKAIEEKRRRLVPDETTPPLPLDVDDIKAAVKKVRKKIAADKSTAFETVEDTQAKGNKTGINEQSTTPDTTPSSSKHDTEKKKAPAKKKKTPAKKKAPAKKKPAAKLETTVVEPEPELQPVADGPVDMDTGDNLPDWAKPG